MHFLAPFLALFLSAISQATSTPDPSSLQYANARQRELTPETMGLLVKSAPAGVAAEAREEFERYLRHLDKPDIGDHYLRNIAGILTQHLPPEKKNGDEVLKHIGRHLTATEESTAAAHIEVARILTSGIAPLEVA